MIWELKIFDTSKSDIVYVPAVMFNVQQCKYIVPTVDV